MRSSLSIMEENNIRVKMHFKMPTASNYNKLLNLLKVEFDLYQQECKNENLTIIFPQVLCEIKRTLESEKVWADVCLKGTAKRECIDIADKISKVYKFFLQIL